MATEEKHEAKKKKRKPRKLTITRHDDGTYSHEHMHDDGKHNLFAGTSTNLDDLKQHVQDTFGGPDQAPDQTADAAGPAAGAAPMPAPGGEGEVA